MISPIECSSSILDPKIPINSQRGIKADKMKTLLLTDSIPRSMYDRQNKIIVAIAVVAVVAIGLVVLICLKEPGITCEFSKVEPIFDKLKPIPRIKSSDNTALVVLDGYLKYERHTSDEDVKQLYLPLKIRSIKHDSSQKLLILKAFCATLTLKLYTNAEGYHGISDIDIEQTVENGIVESCHIHHPIIDIDKPGEHYSCQTLIEDLCPASTYDPSNRNVTRLLLNSFEYQVGGDPDKIKDLEFSNKPGSICSYPD